MAVLHLGHGPFLESASRGVHSRRLRQSEDADYGLLPTTSQVSRQKSQVWDATDPDRIIPDFARADGLSHARAVAEALTQAAGESESSSVDVDALTSLLERDAKSLSVALTGLGARGKGRASGGRRGSRSGGRRGGALVGRGKG